MEKTGRDANLPKPGPHDATAPVYWGTLLEPIVAASYTLQTDRRVMLYCNTPISPGCPLTSTVKWLVRVTYKSWNVKPPGDLVHGFGKKAYPNTSNYKSSINWL